MRAFSSAKAFSISDMVPSKRQYYGMQCFAHTHVSSISVYGVPDSIVDTPRSGIEETRSFLSLKASPVRSDLPHRAFLDLHVRKDFVKGFPEGELTFEVAHVAFY